MKVFLLDYPEVELVQKWTVEVQPCQITDLIPTELDQIVYNISVEKIAFEVQRFKQVPDCGYDLNYQVQLKDQTTDSYQPTPPWLVVDQLSLEVFTEDRGQIGEYFVSIIGSSSSLEQEQLIQVRIVDTCPDDTIIAMNAIEDRTYRIADEGLVKFAPNW